jgi:glycosyltransferase involved in cell wall biosynthesis
MLLSIVVPVLNEEESIDKLCQEIFDAMKDAKIDDYETIIVNDGSTDRTESLLQDISKNDPHLKIISFRRNFGQTAAMSAGFNQARGKYIVAMDGDLQNDPRDIGKLLEKIKEGYDIVSGWRKNRQDKTVSRKIPSWIANWLIGIFTGVRLHDYGCSLKAYRASVLKKINLYGEMHRFIPALASRVGAKIIEMPVNHRARQYGVTKYNISRTFRVVMDLFTVKFLLQFASRPLHLLGIPGLLSFVGGILISFYLTFVKFYFNQDIGGRPLLLLAILLIFIGVQFIGMGLLAEMLSRTYYEASNKPTYYIHREIQDGKIQFCDDDA